MSNLDDLVDWANRAERELQAYAQAAVGRCWMSCDAVRQVARSEVVDACSEGLMLRPEGLGAARR